MALVDERVTAKVLADFHLGRIQGKHKKQPEGSAAHFMTVFTAVIKSLLVRAAERVGRFSHMLQDAMVNLGYSRRVGGKWKFNTAARIIFMHSFLKFM